MLVVIGLDEIHIVKPDTDITLCSIKIPIVTQYIITGEATCSKCKIVAKTGV